MNPTQPGYSALPICEPEYRVGPVPHSVVIDNQGRVRLSIAGGKDDDLQRVQQGVREALREN